MKRFILLSLLLLFSAVPAQVFAAKDCATSTDLNKAYCTCTNSTESFQISGTTFNATTCNSTCFERGGSSYKVETCTSPDPTNPILSETAQANVADPAAVTTSAAASAKKAAPDFQVPILNVKIPGMSAFSTPTLSADGTTVEVNFLAQYINAIYSWILGAAALVAVIMMMIGGLQYVLARGKPKYIDAAKTRITNAITGMVLLLAAYNIAYLIDPNIVDLKAMTIKSVAEIKLSMSCMGAEGSGTPGVTGTWENIKEPQRSIVKSAKDSETCPAEHMLSSPVTSGRLPNQGNHHWFDRKLNGEWEKIAALDWAVSFGSEIIAPFDGKVTSYYQQPAKDTNACGNRIYMKSADGKVTLTICHVKDFTDKDGKFSSTRTVTRGQVIGHSGGRQCPGMEVPENWDYTSATEAFVGPEQAGSSSETPCTDPQKKQSCSCQQNFESGNTSGAHVHVGWSGPEHMLSCLQ
ncbi:MAG: hypothetical protein WCT28_01200 [Patescibacteria group bacterium]|jgi:hypothetical protein